MILEIKKRRKTKKKKIMWKKQRWKVIIHDFFKKDIPI